MPDELLMRQVPQDLTAEQSLLGAMLVDPNCIPEVIEQVRADDFYAEENKRIFETIYSMFNGAQRIDPVTVLDMLTRMGYYDEAGGRAYLFQLMEVTPGAERQRIVRIVRDKSLLPSCDAGSDSAERPRSPRRSLPALPSWRSSAFTASGRDVK
ncbi:MAG: DnaB-like helicase N-terminal domain-containing protein [Butyricicoccus sp.]